MTDISAENLAISNELDSYPSMKRWLADKEPKTVTNYKAYMIRFVQATGMNPEQFLDWAKRVDPVEVNDKIRALSRDMKDGARFNFQIEMRSFLKHQGFNSLPKSKISYQLQDWHEGYKKPEVRKLVSYLDQLPEKLYVYMAVETGFRARTVLAVRYRHIAEDFEAGIVPCAVRLEPKYYMTETGWRKKAPGFTFIGQRSYDFVREGVKNGLIRTKPDSPLVTIGYDGIYNRLTLAKEKAGLKAEIQPNHGLRKYFENALDAARIDANKKAVLEGHFSGVRVRHYTSRDWDELRQIYKSAYSEIDIDSDNPELAAKVVSQEDEIASMKSRLARMEATLQKLLEKKGGPA